jgi:signal transduction histidine kinase
LEPQVQSHFEKSEALQKIRDRWISRVAHDMRGPLFAARGYARLLLEQDSVTAPQKKYAAGIVENTNRLATLVESLAEFPSPATLNLEPVELGDLVAAAVDKIRPRATLQTALLPDGPLWTAADGAKLSTAVHKLLTALVDFSQSSARIEVRASQEDGEFILRGFAAVDPANPPGEPFETPDITAASRILRLHGGAASAGVSGAGMVHVTLRLPVVDGFRPAVDSLR